MTAEAIVMNKYGIALAADSVIASHTASSPKLFNSIEKLFRLSSNGKIAVMVYEATEFMNIPWETLISDYREKLGAGEHESVEHYAADFVAYLKSIQVSAQEEEAILLSALAAHYENLAEILRGQLANQMRDDSSVVKSLRRWVEGQLEKYEAEHGCVVVMDVKTGEIRAHSSALKPLLSPENNKARAAFCLSHIRGDMGMFLSMMDVIQINEKCFYMTCHSRKYYLVP